MYYFKSEFHFSNTYYKNNPTLNDIANVIINKIYDEGDLNHINEAILYNKKDYRYC